MSNCIICNIVQNKIPSERIFENESFVSFLDINPITFGHTLVSPKAHFETLLDLPVDILSKLILIVQDVAKAVCKGTNSNGFNLLQNNHSCAGQSVAHVHMHIIPRKIGDGISFKWNPGKYPSGEISKISGIIRASFQ